MDIPQPENAASLSDKKSENPADTSGSRGENAPDPDRPPQPQSTSKEENTGVAIKNSESESLNSLLVYDSDSSSSSEMMKLNLKWQVREGSEESSSSSSSSSSSEEEDDDDSDTSTEEEQEAAPQVASPAGSRGAIRKSNLKSEGELALDDLPPVPDLSKLNISVEEKFVHMGNVLGIVDKLVTISAIPHTPAYDLDTLLFLDDGKRPLGFVFDVLGQVSSPIYAVRFNSTEDIKNLGVQVGTKVYSAPTSHHTQYVFLQQLLKMKGSDASWFGDNEVPSEFADYSDDENECFQRFGNRKPGPHVKRTHSSDSYKKFESTMNKRNILNTKFNKYMDSYKQARLNKAKAKRPQAPSIGGAVPPAFDPSVPPPSLAHHLTFYPHGAFAYDAASAAAAAANNNGAQTFVPNFFMNNFVSQTNSANYYTNHAGNNHPGPSHE